jgi:hypothetical protein
MRIIPRHFFRSIDSDEFPNWPFSHARACLKDNPALILWFVALLICGLVFCGVLAVIALVSPFRKGDRPKLGTNGSGQGR